jgi:hypothetical protein
VLRKRYGGVWQFFCVTAEAVTCKAKSRPREIQRDADSALEGGATRDEAPLFDF